MMLRWSRLPLFTTLLVATSFIYAQAPDLSSDPSSPLYPSVAAKTKPTIDGVVNPTEWPEEARRTGFVDADTNLTSDEFAEFWITYDETYIYFAGRVKTDPRKVIRDEYRQNVSVSGNDNFTLQLSTTGQPNNFNGFSTNSNGATAIGLAGGRAAKTEWLGEIIANGRLTDTGWECEMQIPWAIMSVPSAGVRDLRFNVYWFRTNKQNTYAFKYSRNDSNLFPTWKDVMVPTVTQTRTLNLLPYGFAGIEEGSGLLANAGLDFKTSLNSQLNLVGTINPDFRNVESSILSLDFSYFERLANENRPFFQEGANYLQTGYSNRLFASQRIPTFDAGLNVYGQLTPTATFGALTTVDFGNRRATAISTAITPKPNDRLELAFVENDQPGLRNQAGMLNFLQNKGKFNWYSTNQFTNDQVQGSGWRTNWGGGYQDGGFSTGIEYLNISADYYPRLGFAPERDLHGYVASVNQEVTPAGGPLNGYFFGLSGLSYDRLDGSFYRNAINGFFEANTRTHFGGGIGFEFSNFEGSSDRRINAGIGYGPDPYRGANINYSVGEFSGIPYENISLSWRYKLANRIHINGSSEFVDFDGHETQHILAARYDIGRYESVGGRLVLQNGVSNWYFSYRLSGKRGAEYFLLIGDPRANVFQNRLVLKAVFPIAIKF